MCTFMLYVFLVVIVFSVLLIRYFSDKVGPMLVNYGEAEARRIITLIINNSISKQALSVTDADSMLKIVRDDNNRIETIDFDTSNVNKTLDYVTRLIQDNLNAVEDGNVSGLNIDLRGVSDIDYEEIKEGIVYYIPMGGISGNVLLNNIGPKIPIKLIMIGDVISSISSDVKEYGINNAMIEVRVDVSVTMLVNMSFVSKEVNVTNSVPIIMKVIQGSVPDYYVGSSNGLEAGTSFDTNKKS